MTSDHLYRLADAADRFTVGSSEWNATFTAPVVRELVAVTLASLYGESKMKHAVLWFDVAKLMTEFLDKKLTEMAKDPRPTALPEVVKKS